MEDSWEKRFFMYAYDLLKIVQISKDEIWFKHWFDSITNNDIVTSDLR